MWAAVAFGVVNGVERHDAESRAMSEVAAHRGSAFSLIVTAAVVCGT